MWAFATGDASTAARLQTEIDKMIRHWNPMARQLSEPVLRCLKAAQTLALKND
jgi:hypothetical protein